MEKVKQDRNVMTVKSEKKRRKRLMKKGWHLAAAILLTVCLSGCGGKEAAEEPVTEKEGGPVNETEAGARTDTWGNGIGQTGWVEYEYDEDGDVAVMELYLENGNLYRRLENEKLEGSSYELSTSTYNANGIQLYSLNTTYYYENGEYTENPNFQHGMDLILEKETSNRTFTPSYFQIERGTLYDTGSGTAYWWVTEYNEEGKPNATTEYFKDGALTGQWTYEYEKGKLTQAHYKKSGSSYDMLTPEYDEEERIIRLSGNRLTLEFTYDEAGRRIAGSWQEGDVEKRMDYEYREDGSLAYCVFCDVDQYGNEVRGTFQYDEAGNLTAADYGYLNGSIGGDDITAYVYEYYDNGICKLERDYQKAEDSDVSWVREYYESGALKREIEVQERYIDETTGKECYEGYQREYDEDGNLKKVIHLAFGDKDISERDENGETVNRELIKDYAEEYPAEEWAFPGL